MLPDQATWVLTACHRTSPSAFPPSAIPPSAPSPTMARCPPRINFVVNRQRINKVSRRRRTYIRRPLAPAERKRRREATQLNTAALDTAIEEWFQFTMAKAQELGKHFNHHPRWILDKMFYRGAHIKKANRTNAWNAWASQLCEWLNAGECCMRSSLSSLM